MKKIISYIALSFFIISLTACAPSIPKNVLELKKESLELRELQTRRYDTSDEKVLLSASMSVLQDLGFNIDESETHLGVIVSSKDRSAVESGQVAGAVAIALLSGALGGGGGDFTYDTKQKIRASLITRPVSAKSTNVRVTFQRIVTNNYGQISKLETVEDPEIYQQFFDKLSKSVFLNANQI